MHLLQLLQYAQESHSHRSQWHDDDDDNDDDDDFIINLQLRRS